MRVTVRSILSLSRAMGGRELLLDMPEGSTVGQVLGEVISRCGEPLSGMIWDASAGKPVSYIRLLVNGRDIGFLAGTATVLQENDELMMIPPAGGG